MVIVTTRLRARCGSCVSDGGGTAGGGTGVGDAVRRGAIDVDADDVPRSCADGGDDGVRVPSAHDEDAARLGASDVDVDAPRKCAGDGDADHGDGDQVAVRSGAMDDADDAAARGGTVESERAGAALQLAARRDDSARDDSARDDSARSGSTRGGSARGGSARCCEPALP